MSDLHLAVTGPMDVPRIARELRMEPTTDQAMPAGRGGHSVTELVIGLATVVDRLDLITLDSDLEGTFEMKGDRTRLAVGRFRPDTRSRSKDLFREERAFVRGVLERWQPHVVSAHWTYEYALGALDSGYPTLITVRDWAPAILRHSRDAYRSVRLLMQIMTFVRGRHFAAVSPYMAVRVHHATRRPVAVLPNALGQGWFAEPEGSPDGCRVVAINNGFGRRKNVHRLLQAWPTVLGDHPDAELVLAGSGYERGGAAEVWASPRGLTESVRFLGPIDRSELPRLLMSARAFVHPAQEESFGMVVLEAMATGVPVVGGKKSGAVPWLLANGAGLLVDVRKPTEIAAGIDALLQSPPLAEVTARKARSRAEAKFSLEAVVGAYEQKMLAVRAGGR